MQNDKVDGFMVKLNNAEEFNKTFKQIMESLKNQSDQIHVIVDGFSDKVTKDLEAGKQEMATESQQIRQLIKDYEVRLINTMSKHREHKDHFNRIENQIVDYSREVEMAKDEI